MPHDLFREDDNGARFLIARYASREEAEEFGDELTRRGHKQHYFVECACLSFVEAEIASVA